MVPKKWQTPPVKELQVGQEQRPEEKPPKRALYATQGSNKTRHLQLRVRVRDTWLNALVDSGAEGNYIDPRIVNQLQLPWKEKSDPYTVINLEGEQFNYDHGIIRRKIDHLKVLVEGKNQGIDFDIVPMQEHDVVLGYPWLQRCNPLIDWRTGLLHIPDDEEYSSDSTNSSGRTRSQTSTRIGEVRHVETRDTTPPKGTKHKQNIGKKHRTQRIIAYLKGQFQKLNHDLKQQEEKLPDRLTNVPVQYRIYQELFKEELETGLPEHSQWDHEIWLKDGTTPTFHKIYNLNEAQLQTLREYLEDNLKKGYIRISKSSAGYPVMFVPKKNGKLRLVVDYRRLNDITLKDRTPLPLITELRDRLHGMNIFTALDLKGAYNLIRIKEGHEWKTAFRTKFGLYEYLVMPFGLTNAPATFQRMINNVLREYLDVFVVCYLDDILIFSRNEEEHTEHVHKVLKALQDAKLLVEPEKSKFHTKEVSFLGHTISPGEIRMDKTKISAVQEWPKPTNLKEVQAFLGFANYYRKFIRNFGQLAIPLTEFTKKGKEFLWNDQAQKSFDTIKQAILSEPVLRTFDPDKEIELETDSSDFALGAQIGQRNNDGKLHPIAFYSHKLHGAELNYPIYDKEFLAIVNAFKEFRHYLMGSKHKVKVYTDHKNIAHFATTQELSRRQLRYAEYLSEFDYVIIHKKGSENGRADAISRRPDFENEKTRLQEQLFSFNSEGNLEQRQLDVITQRRIRSTLQIGNNNETHREIYKFNEELEEKTDKLHVPEHLQEALIQEIHEHPLHGHQGIHKTLERMKETYLFSRMKEKIKEILRKCDTCARTKIRRHKPYGKLQPLPVAQRPWESITFDFIVKLPPSIDPATGVHYDSIFVIVDRFTKFAYYIPIQESTDAEQLAYIFLRNIVSTHGLPNEIISDRGSTFASKFWQGLMAQLGLNHKLTTAFRPQTDGQTERQNQELEQYLRCYVNYAQNDWVEKLPTAQLAHNTSFQSSIKTTPAKANFGFNPEAYRATKDGPLNLKAILTSEQLKGLHEEMKTELEYVRDRMAKYYNQKRLKGPIFSEGDMVYLLAKNINTKRTNKKLDDKYLGPYEIKKKISENNYELKLPTSVKLHPIFHISLLESAEGTIKVSPRKQEPEVEDPLEYKVEKIISKKWINGEWLYEVRWEGYAETENTWEPAKHLTHCQRKLQEFLQAEQARPQHPQQ